MNARQNTLITYRDSVRPADRDVVRRIVASSRFFTEPEIDVAVELVDERLAKGPASGYHFLFAEKDGETIGYSCFGLIACTVSSYDLYWIAVEEAARGLKLGTVILEKSEAAIKALGGTRVYVETSSRPLYEPTRAFYEKRGYTKEAVLADFYAPGDGKVMYVKAV